MRRQLQSREGRCFGHTEERWKAQRRFKESPEICGWGGGKVYEWGNVGAISL